MSYGRILIACAVAMVGACNGNSKPMPAANPTAPTALPVAAPHGPTPAEQTNGMVEAATIGKSTVPVALKFDLTTRPVVNQPFEVVIAVLPQIMAASATVQIVGSDGLQLASDTLPIEISPADPAQAYRETFKMTPTVEGVQLLNLSVALKHDDIVETRAFSLPVIVAPGSEPTAPAKR